MSIINSVIREKGFGSFRGTNQKLDYQQNSFVGRANLKSEGDLKYNPFKFEPTTRSNGSPLVKKNELSRRITQAQFFDLNTSSSRQKQIDRDMMPKQYTSGDHTQPYRTTQNGSSIPSFDALERNLRGFSTSRVKEDFASTQQRFLPQQKQQVMYSPQAAIKSKIGSIGAGADNSQMNMSVRSILKPSRIEPPMMTKTERSQQSAYIVHREPDLKYLFGGSKNLNDLVPINVLVDLRSKIEQANPQTSLPQSYRNELVKLAQVITTQVKQR